MSWDWVERDLTDWAKRTLPEFLLLSMQDPDNKDRVLARTPWEDFSVCVAEVQIDGEVSLTGKKSQALLQFELNIGLRVDIEREGKDDFWSGVLQLPRFESCSTDTPDFSEGRFAELLPRLDDLPKRVAAEVGWYMKDGMGRRYLQHALDRWYSYALRKWTSVEPPEVPDPYRNVLQPPLEPPFAADFASSKVTPSASAQLAVAAPGAAVPFIGRKPIPPQMQQQQQSLQLQDGGQPPEEERTGAGAGTQAQTQATATAGILSLLQHEGQEALTTLDVAHAEAVQRRLKCSEDGEVSALALRTKELCEAIERGDIMKAFSRLDEQTVNAENPANGKRPTHCCVLRGSKEMLQMLIEGRADLDKRDAAGLTPLMAAAKSGDRDLVQILLDGGANPALCDELGRSAVELVPKDKEEAPVLPRPVPGFQRAIAPAADWRQKLAKDPAVEAALKIAEQVEREQLEKEQVGSGLGGGGGGAALRRLLDSRERPKRFGEVLLTALAQRDGRTAEAAIEAGGNPNARDDRGDTPVLALVRMNWKDEGAAKQVHLLQALFRAGADLSARDAKGSTALHFAAHRGRLDLVQVLLKSKANPGSANNEGNTPLMYSAHRGNEELCTLLLEATANPSLSNRHGLTAAAMAKQQKFTNCAILIDAYEMAPPKKLEGENGGSGASTLAAVRPKKKEKVEAFDYSKWDKLEQEMREEEALEEQARAREDAEKKKPPPPKFEDLGPEAFGLPADTPWPPTDERKGPFDYDRWDKVAKDLERQEEIKERFEELQRNPRYEYRDGEKMQVIF